MEFADFFRRKKDRPSHDAETAGPTRFFRTAAGPGATPYPTSGIVYYGELLRDATYAKSIPGSGPSYVGTGQYDYLGFVPGGCIIPENTVVMARKVGARWWIKRRCVAAASAPSSGPLVLTCLCPNLPGTLHATVQGTICGSSIFSCPSTFSETIAITRPPPLTGGLDLENGGGWSGVAAPYCGSLVSLEFLCIRNDGFLSGTVCGSPTYHWRAIFGMNCNGGLITGSVNYTCIAASSARSQSTG